MFVCVCVCVCVLCLCVPECVCNLIYSTNIISSALRQQLCQSSLCWKLLHLEFYWTHDSDES